MIRSLEHAEGQYERPHRLWRCGHLDEGRPCPGGPDARGRCRAAYECRPYRQGDRWLCTRPPTTGGACERGPYPDGTCCRPIERCVPRRSPWGRRRLASIWAATFTVGLVTLALSGAPFGDLLVPGPLTGHHGRIADCGDCHESYHEGPAGWVLAALEGSPVRDDTQRCLTCHEHDRDEAGAPHTLPPALLDAGVAAGGERQPIEQALIDVLFTPPHEAVHNGLACATCHSEHRGARFDQTELSNERCQTCHGTTFAALADGHPPFTDYPYRRRTRIVFDHRSHATRHFAEHDPPRENVRCIDCHAPSAMGGGMIVRGYEETCAECHDGDIGGVADAGPRGVAVMRVPGIDLVELRERGIGIGGWPEFADEPLTPFMRVLLEAEPGMADALARIEDIDLLDLRDAGAEEVAAVERLAWAVKGLVRDLAVEGAPGLAERMAGGLGVPIDERRLRELTGLLPPDVAHAAQQAWFPDLHRELALHARGEPVPPVLGALDEPAAEVPTPSIAGTGDLLAGDGGAGDILASGADAGDLLTGDGGTGDILASDAGAGDLLAGDVDADEILASDAGADDILTGDTGGQTDGLLAGDTGGGETAVGLFPAAPSRTESADLPDDDMPPDVDHERLARLGGWYRSSQTLYYRPAGHADPFLRSYVDIAGNAAEGSEARHLFSELTAEDAPGRCNKCHSIDQRADGGLEAQWLPWRPDIERGAFTVFSHETHFSLLGEKGCVTCHTLGAEETYLDSFSNHDPAVFASNFDTLPVSVCADCHTPDVAGDDCTLCHRYHVGQFITRTMPTEMADMMTRKPAE